MIKFLFKILILLVILSCSSEPDNYKYYYFPVEDFETPKVYVLSNQNKPDESVYYAIKSFSNSGEKYLHTEIFDYKFRLVESIRMRINESGAFADEYIYTLDTMQYSMKIYSDTMMVWDRKVNSRFLFEASLNRPEQRNQQVIKKVSYFTGKSEVFNYENVDYKTVELSEDVFFNDGNDAISIKKALIQFARGLGIVRIDISKTKDETESYVLKRIINFNEWKTLQTK